MNGYIPWYFSNVINNALLLLLVYTREIIVINLKKNYCYIVYLIKSPLSDKTA